jgi:ABC-2 type transport system permease protein/Cu-processing system permease protein
LHAHVTLVGVAAFLPLLTPGEAMSRGASWWLLHAVLYAISLSALLLGLSSAHAEADEFTWLLVQPAGLGPWLAGKVVALAMLVGSASALLVVPTLMAGAGSVALVLTGLGAAGLSIVCALAGLALGFWIRDGVRGLIAALALWFALLFGTDFVLLGTAGHPWTQAHPDLWVAPLMLNPLDAFRITILFVVQRAAFTGFVTGELTGWWIAHAGTWLLLVIVAWSAAATTLAWCGARRRTDN